MVPPILREKIRLVSVEHGDLIAQLPLWLPPTPDSPDSALKQLFIDPATTVRF